MSDMQPTDVSGTTKALTLRALADWLEAHPEAEQDVYGGGTSPFRILDTGYANAAEMAARAREIGGRWEKNTDEQGVYFRLEQEILPGAFYEIYEERELVCERVVVGVTEREVEEPDPEAVAQLPKVKRVEKVERVEWVCPPSLLGSGRAA